jgi:hypothetical protein
MTENQSEAIEMINDKQIARLGSHPESIVELSHQQAHSLDTATLNAFQLEAAMKRFDDLVGRIPILKKLAEENHIDSIRSLDDLAPLLVQHTAYKSYPLSVLENGDFKRLTRWFNGFTTVDLTSLDASSCDSIDDWIDLLDTETDIQLLHSSGTSGKLSFLPRTRTEAGEVGLVQHLRFFEGFGEGAPGPVDGYKTFPVVYPGFRYGASGQMRRIENIRHFWHRGNGTPIVALYPGRLSADALSLGGRLMAAEARGELGRLKISPKLLAKRDEILAEQKKAPEYIEHFLDAITELKGERIYMQGIPAQFYDIAVAGQKRGMKNLFHPDSLLIIGGGTKGRNLPDDMFNTVSEFTGTTAKPVYGMSEVMGGAPICEHGFYHMHPSVILIQIDPNSGAQLPRRGTVTGRLGIFDTTCWTYWGGFLSGDEVTINWADRETCACGRTGPYLHPSVRRYSEKEGGDDKITCAGAPDAHNKALDFVIDQLNT